MYFFAKYVLSCLFTYYSCIIVKVDGKECIWSGIDYALEPPVRRILRAIFSSMQAAQEMHTFFEDVSKDTKIYAYALC